MAGERAAGGIPPAASDSRAWVDWRVRHDRPLYRVTLWPNRSLTPRMRRGMLGIVAAGAAVPLLALTGTSVFWVLAPFAALPVLLLWAGFRRNDRDGRLTERLVVWRDEVRVERREPGGRVLRWTAEPLHLRLRLHDTPIESYLTLKGMGREIELGAFLSPEERVALAAEIEAAVTRALRG